MRRGSRKFHDSSALLVDPKREIKGRFRATQAKDRPSLTVARQGTVNLAGAVIDGEASDSFVELAGLEADVEKIRSRGLVPSTERREEPPGHTTSINQS